MLLQDKIAIVTGGGQGIGRGYAEGLAREGAKVVIADLSLAHARETVDIIRAKGQDADCIETDVSNAAACQAMADFTAKRFGGIDILVNNAGILAGLPSESFMDMPEERWDRVFAVNTKGVWFCTRAAVPHIQKRGGGAIVNQTSTAAYIATPNRMNYTVSKTAVIPMTKTMARELGPMNIRVNAIAPGPILTEALKDVPKEALDKIKQAQCIKRFGMPEDLVGGLLFLVSDMSSWMSGQVLTIDGGNVMPG